MKKDIILISNFPFGDLESFLANELQYICSSFRSVYIFNSGQKLNKPENIILPDNCLLYDSEYHKIVSLKFSALYNLFSKFFYVELFHLVFFYGKLPKLSVIKTILNSLRNAQSIKKSIENKIDLCKSEMTVYSYWCDDSATAIAMIAKKYPKHKYISRSHGWDLYFERSSCNYLPFKKLLIRNLNQIHFISFNGLNYFRKKHRVKDVNKLFLSRLGVLGRLSKKENFEYSKGKTFTILSNSYVYSNKRVELIAKVVSKLDGNVNWFHIGNAYKEIDFVHLQNISKNLLGGKKGINYTFLGGISNFEVYKFLETTKVDLFINLSLSEGIPVSFMEVMSFGIPVIGTDVGGVNEILNASNGILVQKDLSASAIAKLIGEFWSKNEIEIQKYRANAFNQWKSQFNADLNYNKFTENIK